MVDKHLNLFYTYNRDTELIENNLTRAFIVFLSIISGQKRHNILSKLLTKPHKVLNKTIDIENLDFTKVQFALQSNIDRQIPKNSGQKILLTISTEQLDTSIEITGMGTASVSEVNSGGNFSSVPDAWLYDNSQVFCILIEAKVGSYPLDISQLQSHAVDWFGSTLQNLIMTDALYSVTWVDVLETLKEILNEYSGTELYEDQLISHLVEFIGYYGYRLFDGIDFCGLQAQPSFLIGRPLLRDRITSKLNFKNLEMAPNFWVNFLSH